MVMLSIMREEREGENEARGNHGHSTRSAVTEAEKRGRAEERNGVCPSAQFFRGAGIQQHHIYTYTHIYMYICICIYVYICISVYVYMCICVYVYMYAHIYIYIYVGGTFMYSIV